MEVPYLKNIKNKLIVENAKDLSDKELERCLKNTVSHHKLIRLARKYRDIGILKPIHNH